MVQNLTFIFQVPLKSSKEKLNKLGSWAGNGTILIQWKTNDFAASMEVRKQQLELDMEQQTGSK